MRLAPAAVIWWGGVVPPALGTLWGMPLSPVGAVVPAVCGGGGCCRGGAGG